MSNFYVVHLTLLYVNYTSIEKKMLLWKLENQTYSVKGTSALRFAGTTGITVTEKVSQSVQSLSRVRLFVTP